NGGCAPAAPCWPTPSTNPLRTPDSGGRCGGAGGASLARAAAARRTHPSISRSTAGSAPRATKSARSLLVRVELRQLRRISAARSILERDGGGGGAGVAARAGTGGGAVPEVLEVPGCGAERDATGGAAAVGGFAAWRVGAGAVARCRKLANIAPTLLPSAETFP